MGILNFCVWQAESQLPLFQTIFSRIFVWRTTLDDNNSASF